MTDFVTRDVREAMTALQRARDTLIGARVVSVEVGADGSLYVELEHRGTDDDACTLNVEPDQIAFKDGVDA